MGVACGIFAILLQKRTVWRTTMFEFIWQYCHTYWKLHINSLAVTFCNTPKYNVSFVDVNALYISLPHRLDWFIWHELTSSKKNTLKQHIFLMQLDFYSKKYWAREALKLFIILFIPLCLRKQECNSNCWAFYILGIDKRKIALSILVIFTFWRKSIFPSPVFTR